jgi:very-short-patch-repair endonuclease
VTPERDPAGLIIARASTAYGNVRRERLLELGLTAGSIKRRIANGTLYPAHNGVYGVGRPPRTPIERADAAVLACGPGAALFGPGAMVLWDWWERWPETLEVVARKQHRRPGIIVHSSKFLGPAEIATQRGIRVTKPARTQFDIALRLNDEQLARTVNTGLHSKYLTRGHLSEQVLRHPTHPSANRIRPYVLTENGPTRSDWERALPVFTTEYDLPPLLLSQQIAGFEADAVWLPERIVLELDSWEFHSERGDFESDRDRDVERLLAGFVTVRLTWERMHTQPAREARRLHQLLANRRNGLA